MVRDDNALIGILLSVAILFLVIIAGMVIINQARAVIGS